MTAWIGPVQLVDLFEPQLTFTGTPTALGLQPGQITGQTEWWQAHQLKELVNNPHRRVTIGGQSGVLEPIYFSDPMLGPLTSWCLLQSFQLGQADQTHSLQSTTGLVPYTLTLVSLGPHRRVVLVRSARAEQADEDFQLVPLTFVADLGGSSDFTVDPGGLPFTRPYDPSYPHDPRSLLAADGIGVMALRAAPLSAGTDGLDPVVLPSLVEDGTSPPSWITQRGADCRAFDARTEHEVYGPSHHWGVTTDLLVSNGIVRFHMGGIGDPAHLNVEALSDVDRAWHPVGTCKLTSSVLRRARLTRLTPDVVTLAVELEDSSDEFVVLQRGERMLRSSFAFPEWQGVPLPTRGVNPANATGRFGKGLAGGGSEGSWESPYPTWEGEDGFSWDGGRIEPDIRLRWPAAVSAQAFATSLRWRPERASTDIADSGLLSIYAAEGPVAVQVFFSSADHMVKAKMGEHTVSSPTQTFDADADLLIGVRFSTIAGLTLSVRAADGSVNHSSDPLATDPQTILGYAEIGYLVRQLVSGDTYTSSYSSSYDGTATWGDDGSTWLPEVHANGALDNHMIFEDRLIDVEFEVLAAATAPLGGLPVPAGRLRWWAPFDAAPIVRMGLDEAGQIVDPLTDEWGFQKAVVSLQSGLNRDASGIVLARSATFDDIDDHQNQLAAASEQQTRVR